MATQLVRRLVCMFRKYQWRVEFNRETQGTEAECLRCGDVGSRIREPRAQVAETRSPATATYKPVEGQRARTDSQAFTEVVRRLVCLGGHQSSVTPRETGGPRW